MAPTVLILMATYNGEAYIEQQIASIVRQTYSNWQLLIRDDGSDDHTIALLDRYAKHDRRIEVLKDSKGNQGVVGNFSLLLDEAYQREFDYFALADQDDVWVDDKLKVLMSEMHKLHSSDVVPTLLHSDLEVVDSDLRHVDASLMAKIGVSHQSEKQLNVLLCENFVTGCAVLFNRALLEHALPLPKNVPMHDWWFALCASVFGQLQFIDQPLVKYRQHGSNQVGAKTLWRGLKKGVVKSWRRGRDNLYASMLQAYELHRRLQKVFPDNPWLNLIAAYADLRNKPPLRRVTCIYRYGIHAHSKGRQTLMVFKLLLM